MPSTLPLLGFSNALTTQFPTQRFYRSYQKDFFKKGERVVFLHTGGAAALFGYDATFNFTNHNPTTNFNTGGTWARTLGVPSQDERGPRESQLGHP